MPDITVYTSRTCRVCRMVKDFLDDAGLPYEEIHVDLNPVAMLKLIGKRGRFTVPQTEIGGTWIAGFDPLKMLETVNTLNKG
ncbi:hypothetical protein NCCP2716_22280 [Sporosarcina sp. NCCP-2716]|uniref:glutaredoxin family protein n=1 Tax=Sporosarcina sp. NCCP-2716 TaxID=2943679 RepID=UPI0020417A64|nr:glutaredoxin family protein [Sporosarcina sp. NCCP-2716]GKV69730.1 hypothetical protein NCCP2716_22280 [Sporosarcina sp. NCCP-2716]